MPSSRLSSTLSKLLATGAALAAVSASVATTYEYRKVVPGLQSDGVLSAPVFSVSAAELDFGNVTRGQQRTLSAVLSNISAQAAPFTAPALGGAISLAHDCPVSVEAGASCLLQFTYAPTSAATHNQWVSLGGGAGLRLLGQGEEDLSFELSASSLSFAPTPVGSTASLSLLVLNTGTASLSAASVLTSGAAFSATHDCPASLPVGQSCTVQGTFAAPAMGSYSGSLQVSFAGASPRAVPLSGLGLQAQGSLGATSSADFGSVAVGTSATRDFIFSNSGNTSATQVQASVAGEGVVLVANTCGTASSPATVAAGSSCLMTVQWTPAAAGSLDDASLSVASSAATSPSMLTLSGTAVSYTASLSGSSLGFGSLAVGSSQTLGLVLTNTGTGTLTLGAVQTEPGPFSASTNCPAALAAGASCDIQVAFAPSAAGSFSSTLSLVSNAQGSPFEVALSGTGLQASVSLVPQSGTSFGDVLVGSSPTRVFTFTNTGNAPATSVQASVSGTGLTLSANTCGTSASPVTVAAGASCSMTVSYAPTSAGSLSGAVLSVSSSALGSPHQLSLSGTAVQAVGSLSANTGANFGAVATNTHASLGFTFSNTGTASTTGVYVALQGTGLSTEFNSCGTQANPGTVAPGATCSISVRYAPTSVGTLSSAFLRVHSSAVGSPHETALSGSALNPVSLQAAVLPQGTRNQAYTAFNFATLLSVSNEASPDLGQVSWSLSGSLPAGMTFANGTLWGTPTQTTAAGGTSFTVIATYKNNVGQRVYVLQVGKALLEVVQISVGNNHACAITTAGGAVCWGRGSSGQLGNGVSGDSLTPVNVTGLSSGVTRISAGNLHTCAVHNGAAKCWGSNGFGRLGNNSTTASNAPVTAISSGVAAVSAGLHHTCARLTSGAARCWGYNAWGQLGDNSVTHRLIPTAVSGLTSGVTDIVAGYAHSCAVVNGAARCWGWNGYGEVGDGTTTQRQSPATAISSGVSRVVVTTGSISSCALMTTGAVRCWGGNAEGAVGVGDLFDRLTPTQVSGLSSGVTSLAAGSAHVCAVVSGAAQCWGRNASGQLGDGTTTLRNTPVAVSGLSGTPDAVAVGGNTSCVRLSNNTARCWGDNQFGQLGDGTGNSSATPVGVQQP